MSKFLRIVSAGLACILVVGAGAAQAAAARKGGTAKAIEALARGNAVAYDSVNKVYLVVSSHGVLRGRFIAPDGTPMGLPFAIQANPANFAHFPRVAFSPDADGGTGGFLVTWHEGAPSTHARMVSLGKNGAYGNDTQLTNDTSWWEAGNAVAYATGSKEFLVAWRSMPVRGGAASNDIHAVRLDNSATPKAAVLAVTNDANYQDNPSVAYNPVTDEFMLVFAGYSDAGHFAFVDAQRLKAGANALTGAVTRLTQTGGTYITDVTYNPASNTFLASWYAAPAGAALGRIINADGTLSGNIITLSTRYRGYDALSVAYNRRSDTFLMVSHGPTAEDGAVELNSAGTPIDNGFLVTGAGGSGNFYPRVSASSEEANWLVSTANNFTSTMVQLVAGTASATAPTDPAPAPSPSPTPGAPQPNPKMNVDYPGVNLQVAGNAFLVSGWALDQGASAGTGVDAIDVWAFPVGSTTATLVGSATYGIARPDVAGFVGAQFTNCGFTLVGSLGAPGPYDLWVYAHSTVTGTWNNVKVVRVTAQAPVSNPKMWLDTPSVNQTTSQNLTVGGWAVDLGASTGTGIDAIHVYGYPTSGAAILVGVATYGTSRPDVAGYLGASRFAQSGFILNGTLPPGDYTLVAFAHSTVTNTFNNVVQAPIKVR